MISFLLFEVVISWKDFCFYPGVTQCQKLSDVIHLMILNCQGLLVPRPPKGFFGVKVVLLTGHGNATHCQVQTLASLGNCLAVVPVCFLFHAAFLCLLLSLTLLLSCVSQWLLGKSSKWRQMPWSFTAFSTLALAVTLLLHSQRAGFGFPPSS